MAAHGGLNPKPETRNPKELRKPKSEGNEIDCPECEAAWQLASEQGRLLLGCSIFGLRISIFFRISDLGFRISRGSFKVFAPLLQTLQFAGRAPRFHNSRSQVCAHHSGAVRARSASD